MSAAFERTKVGREKIEALMQQQRTEVRGVLTAAQQQTFDKNVAAAKKARQRTAEGPTAEGPTAE